MSDVDTTLEAAAQRLGIPVKEILGLEETFAGMVVHVFDGTSYIDVPAEHPDEDGKSGLMYLRKPTSEYNGTFPVFAGELEVAHPIPAAPEAPATAPAEDPAPEAGVTTTTTPAAPEAPATAPAAPPEGSPVPVKPTAPPTEPTA